MIPQLYVVVVIFEQIDPGELDPLILECTPFRIPVVKDDLELI
jgi:hypothetical protein